jgi:hypothetical protein
MKKADELQEKIAQVDNTEELNKEIDKIIKDKRSMAILSMLQSTKVKQRAVAIVLMRLNLSPSVKERYVNRLTALNHVYARLLNALNNLK